MEGIDQDIRRFSGRSHDRDAQQRGSARLRAMRRPPLLGHWDARRSSSAPIETRSMAHERVDHQAVRSPDRGRRSPPALPGRQQSHRFCRVTGHRLGGGAPTASKLRGALTREIRKRSAADPPGMWSSRQAVVDPLQEFLDFLASPRSCREAQEACRRRGLALDAAATEKPFQASRRCFSAAAIARTTLTNRSDCSGVRCPILRRWLSVLRGSTMRSISAQAEPPAARPRSTSAVGKPAAGRVDQDRDGFVT